MSALVVIGKVTDALGHAEHRATTFEGQRAIETRSYEALASIEYRGRQPAPIPVRSRHGGRDVGRVLHLERTPDGGIVAVTTVTHADNLLIPADGPWFWSPELRYRRGGEDIEISELVITTQPATIGLTELEVHAGSPRQAADQVRCRHQPQLAALLDRAIAAERRRPLGGSIVVEDPTAQQTTRLADGSWITGHGDPIPPESRHRAGSHTDDDYQQRPPAPIEYWPSTGCRVISVR